MLTQTVQGFATQTNGGSVPGVLPERGLEDGNSDPYGDLIVAHPCCHL